jgi:hypothetical protein
MPPNEPRFSCGRNARRSEFYGALAATADRTGRRLGRSARQLHALVRPPACLRTRGPALILDLSPRKPLRGAPRRAADPGAT